MNHIVIEYLVSRVNFLTDRIEKVSSSQDGEIKEIRLSYLKTSLIEAKAALKVAEGGKSQLETLTA